MKKLLILLLLGSMYLNAQIKMVVKIINKYDGKRLNISIVNSSSDTYVIPIDTIGYKTYHSENKCTNFDMIRNYPDLGIIPMITRNNNNYIESLLENRGMLLSDKNLYRNSDEKYKRERKYIINQWGKQNRIKGKGYKWLNINYYLYNHLIILKPHQEITFEKKFDHKKINEYPEIYFYDYYPLEKGIIYDIFLKICVDESIYEYLTQKQKDNFKNYYFFKGELVSNTTKL